jgi:hypothetical protein
MAKEVLPAGHTLIAPTALGEGKCAAEVVRMQWKVGAGGGRDVRGKDLYKVGARVRACRGVVALLRWHVLSWVNYHQHPPIPRMDRRAEFPKLRPKHMSGVARRRSTATPDQARPAGRPACPIACLRLTSCAGPDLRRLARCESSQPAKQVRVGSGLRSGIGIQKCSIFFSDKGRLLKSF